MSMMSLDPVLSSRRSSFPFAQLAGDLSAAAISASLIAPVVTAIDRAVVENAAAPSRYPLLRTLRHHTWSIFRHPTKFTPRKPFFIIWTLYAATYATANTSDTLARRYLRTAEQATISSITFLTTFIVNVPLGVWKDVRYAQIFSQSHTPPPPSPAQATSTGAIASVTSQPEQQSSLTKTSTSPRPPPLRPSLPLLASSTFLFRDAITLLGSFALTPLLSTYIPDTLATTPQTKAALTQLIVPIFSQLAATPVHLFGLDLVSRPQGVRMAERVTRMKANLGMATVVRCARIVPAFGVGCVVNTDLRGRFQGWLGGGRERERCEVEEVMATG